MASGKALPECVLWGFTTGLVEGKRAEGKGQRAKGGIRRRDTETTGRQHKDSQRAKLCVSASCLEFPVWGKDDRCAYGEVTGVIWLQISCQPVGVFAKTMLLWNWPLVVLPLSCPFSVTRLIATATSPP